VRSISHLSLPQLNAFGNAIGPIPTNWHVMQCTVCAPCSRRARGWAPLTASPCRRNSGANNLCQANNKIFDRQRHDDMTDILILWCLQCWSKKEISLGWFCPSLLKNFALSQIFPVLWIHKKRSLRDKPYPKAPVVAIKSHLYPIELPWTPHLNPHWLLIIGRYTFILASVNDRRSPAIFGEYQR
jgi:hypothetical protein